MGSPEDEPGRYEDEGPVHQVVFSAGFWLSEYPCTQDLWTAVMGENPSRFQHPRRPVEQVSWDDTQHFFERIEQILPGLGLRLPTEAQWEYACRAGTTEATYAGPIVMLGENHAPVLDDIAWYGGNSGVGYDLEEAVDSRDWRQKQYQHERAGTRKVGGRRANPWGLYDMLGNVWEWCADEWPGSYAPHAGRAARGEPAQGAEPEVYRVYRGGAWLRVARHVRAACRDRERPSERWNSVGFRLCRSKD